MSIGFPPTGRASAHPTGPVRRRRVRADRSQDGARPPGTAVRCETRRMQRTPGDLISRSATGTGTRRPHLHLFSRQGDAPFGNGSLYVCRCGVVRPAM
ncbi:hypothetical protein GCM10028783_32540 [Modestobacter muralis]